MVSSFHIFTPLKNDLDEVPDLSITDRKQYQTNCKLFGSNFMPLFPVILSIQQKSIIIANKRQDENSKRVKNKENGPASPSSEIVKKKLYFGGS